MDLLFLRLEPPFVCSPFFFERVERPVFGPSGDSTVSVTDFGLFFLGRIGPVPCVAPGAFIAIDFDAPDEFIAAVFVAPDAPDAFGASVFVTPDAPDAFGAPVAVVPVVPVV